MCITPTADSAYVVFDSAEAAQGASDTLAVNSVVPISEKNGSVMDSQI